MNLSIDKWIPVVGNDGAVYTISLLDFFQHGEEYADFAMQPEERISVMRFLICISQAAIDGPNTNSPKAIDKARKELPALAVKYLKKRHSVFDLYGDTPFLQIPGLVSNSNKSAAMLNPTIACGNNSIHFDHDAIHGNSREFSDEWKALNLLVCMNFSPCGLVPRAKWGRYESAKSAKSSSLLQSFAPIHTFIRRENILDTVFSNILSKKQVEEEFGPDKWGRPVWDMFPSKWSDEAAKKNATTTYLGRLVPLTRLLLIDKDSDTIVIGAGYEFDREPFAPSISTYYSDNKKCTEPRRYSETSLWRELASIFISYHIAQSERGRGTYRGPLAFKNIDLNNQTFDVWTGGLVAPMKPSVVKDSFESVFTIPTGVLGDDEWFVSNICFAKDVLGKLAIAIRVFVGDDKKSKRAVSLIKAATMHFWECVELVRESAYSDNKWTNIISKIAFRVYDNTVDYHHNICERSILGRMKLGEGIDFLAKNPKNIYEAGEAVSEDVSEGDDESKDSEE